VVNLTSTIGQISVKFFLKDIGFKKVITVGL